MLNISAAGWDTDSGASRVPIHITGKTVDGITVDKVEFVASDGSGISLIQGVYTLEAAGSPIATDGKIYQIPCTSATLVLDDVFTAGETINLAELAEQNSILTFCPIDASDMTNDEIYDADLIVKSATKTGHVVTVEEHSVIGGLGSAVADVLCEQCPTPLKKIGVNDTFGESGPGAELLHKYGLDAANIVATTKEFLA